MATGQTARRRPPAGQQKMSRDESIERINMALALLADAHAVHEEVASGIRDHKESYHLKPEEQTLAESAELYARAAADEKMVEPYVHTFKHRPWDVALSFVRVCRENYGVPPVALPARTNPFTGEPMYQSAMVEIPVSATDTVSMPYGTVGFPALKAEVTYDDTRDARLGVVGQISILCPRRYHASARGLCKLVEKDLETNSIYKGKAITSAHEPLFLDPWKATNAEEIIWTREVDAGIRGSMLNIVRYTDRARERGHKIHRSVLFKGEPGNGKSETINIIAQHCVDNGWTYILGTTTLADALNQARMYAPAVIALEDFERLVEEADQGEVSDLLEELDGTTSKEHDIMLVATTNFVDDLNQRIRRRFAKEIEFGAFDAEACARYLEVRTRGIAEDNLDFQRVANSMDGWGNSYIAKVVEFAAGIALEHDNPQLRTQDLLDAAEAQRPDWEAYRSSQLREPPRPFETAFKGVLKQAMLDQDVVLQNPSIGQIDFVKAGGNGH